MAYFSILQPSNGEKWLIYEKIHWYRVVPEEYVWNFNGLIIEGKTEEVYGLGMSNKTGYQWL